MSEPGDGRFEAMVEAMRPTYGTWLTHHCEPPCELERIATAQAARKRMRKIDLILQAEQGDEAWLDQSEWLSMTEHYLNDVEAHLKDVHGCDHDIYAEIGSDNGSETPESPSPTHESHNTAGIGTGVDERA